MAGYRVETKHTSFDSPLTIHPWDGLVKQLCDNIAPEEINRLIFLARRQLGDRFGEIKDQRDCKCEAFFTALRDKFEDESADVVLNLFECENLHNDQGAFRFADYITKYKEEKHKYDKDNKTLKNVDFIGRESLVTKVTTYLLHDRPVGVILCGMSGMGKTAVANEVSWRLKCQKPQWKIVRLSEMEKMDIRDLYKNLIYTLLETFQSDLNLKLEDEVTTLKCHLNLVFNTVLADRIQNILIYIDNVDDHCLDRQALREFEGFLTELVRLIHVPRSEDIKVRVLITVQKKIFGELDPSSAEVSWAGGNIVQIEVTPMDDIDATALLRKQSRLSEKDLTGDLCCSINKSVGGNPMALLQVAIDLPFVRTFNRGFDELISSLTDPTTSLHNQLDKSINRIPRTDVEYSHIDVLVNLSLFKTAWFSFEQAAQIGVGLNKDSYGTKFNEKHERNTRTILSLLILRGQHLIEIDKQGVGEDISTSRNFILYWYSLHPLIYKHVHQKYVENVSEKDKHKKASLENARLRYMRYFCKEIDKFGEKYGTKPHEAQALLEKTRVHMKNFYEYFLNGTIRIDDVMTDTKGDKEFTTLDCKRYSLWKMLDYVQTAETKINFARRLSSDAERECKLYVYVYWTCKEVEFHLAAGQTIRACSIFTELSNKLGIVSDDVRTLLEQRLPWKLEDVERYPMFGVYFETKARTLKEENSKNKGIVDCLENARKLYNQSIKVTTKKQYQMLRRDDIARVVDSIGNYHFVNGDFNKSKEYHEKALCIVQKDKHGCAINMKELTEFKHPSSSEYLTNIAACEHELGRAAPDSGTKTELLEGAKEKYTFCIEYDKTMKRDFLQSHAQKLMNRAEIYSQLKKLDLAIQDAMKALKIFKQHYSMPNATKTLSYAQLAYFYYKKGRKSSNPAERKEVLKQSINLYDDALCEITHGGLPSDHKEFKDIKDFHMKAMKAAGLTEMDVQQRVNRYSDFILGKYDKKINKIRQTDPGRSLQTELQKLELQGAVGVVVPSVYVDSNTGNIGHDVVSEMVADIRSSTSSSEQEEDDSNEWEGFDDDLDDLIASSTQRKRRDSGVEDDIEIAPESSNGDKPHLDKMEVVPTVSVVKDVGSELGSYIDSGVKQCPDESSTVKSVDMHEAIDTETKPGNLDDAQHRLDDKQIDSDSYTTKIVDDSISQEDTGRDAEIEKMETGQTGSASESVSVMKGKVGANKRSLRRQESVDIESHFDDVPEQRSSMKDVDQSDCVSLDEEQRRKRRRSSIDTGFGDGNRLSTSTIRSSFGSSTNRSSLSSIGSQDSVTSMLGKRLNLQSDLSLHPEDDPNALDKETGD